MTQTNLIIAIAIGIPIIAIMFIATRSCTRLMWFTLFCYPHALTAGVLPLNIGMDDLYIVTLGIVVLLKRIFSGRTVLGFATIGALLFWFVETGSNMTGALTGPGFLMEGAIKATIKGVSYIIFGFIVDNTIDDRKDIESTIKWLMVAGICGTITVIGQALYEPLFRIFTWYRPELWQMETVRGGGAFLNPNNAGAMMILFLVFCISRLKVGETATSRFVLWGMCLLFLVGLVLTRSRSAWAGMAAVAFFLLLFSRLRRYVFLVVIIGLIGILTSELAKGIFYTRLVTAGFSAVDRVGIWLTIVGNATGYIVFFGRGATAEWVRLQATPHNTYIHILFELGFFGAAWAIWFFGKLFRNARFLQKYGYEDVQFAGDWAMYTLLGLAVFGIAAEILFIPFVRYVLFFMAALVYRWKLLINEELMLEQYEMYDVPSEERDDLLQGVSYENYYD